MLFRSNASFQEQPDKIIININLKEAEKIAKEKCGVVNKDAKKIIVLEKNYKAFVDGEDKKTELCYVLTIECIRNEEKKDTYKYFISTNTGKIVSFKKENISKNMLS